MPDDKIAVDDAFLAKCLGLKKWPEWGFPGAEPGPAYLNNWQARYAARVITDALRPDSITGKIHADIAIHNAKVWIADAYNAGLQQGMQLERKEWERKIARMFGLRGGRNA